MNLVSGNYIFEAIKNVVYCGSAINNTNDTRLEIRLRIGDDYRIRTRDKLYELYHVLDAGIDIQRHIKDVEINHSSGGLEKSVMLNVRPKPNKVDKEY